MGLAEYIKAGAGLSRQIIDLQTNSSGSGSVNLGSAYTLLTVTTDAPCRLRLYDTAQSLTDSGERIRPFTNTKVSASTALIGDFSMSSAGIYTIDPVMYSVIENSSNLLTYYRVDNTASAVYPKVQFNRYLLENSSVSTANRVNLPVINATLSASALISGTLASTSIPTTYLLVSASVSGSATRARLRLYSKTDAFSDMVEVSRSFTTESSATTKLIVDMILSGSETTYFVPKIIGANLQNMPTSLATIVNSTENIMGKNELYYILQNAATSGGPVPISASLHIFSLED